MKSTPAANSFFSILILNWNGVPICLKDCTKLEQIKKQGWYSQSVLRTSYDHHFDGGALSYKCQGIFKLDFCSPPTH
jgi:hypothetical protein